MIEKWRPAKMGDGGIARFRDGNDGHWRIGELKRSRLDASVVNVMEFFDGYDWWLHCEVLEAYISDDEVNSLCTSIQKWRHDQLVPTNPFKRLAQVIIEHFSGEKGGE